MFGGGILPIMDPTCVGSGSSSDYIESCSKVVD